MRLAGLAITLALVSGLAATAGAAGRLYLTAPPAAHTGGLGDPDCTACHFDNPANADGGSIRVSGFPERYEPGTAYRITLRVERPGTRLAGFQAAVRYRSGTAAGRQAGSLRALDARADVLEANAVQYVHHTEAGATATHGAGRWSWEWTAPREAGADVVLHAAANAANGDNSEFGDFIYLAEIVALPPRDGSADSPP